MSQPLYIKIKDQDNVAIAVKDIKAGTEVMDGVIAHQDIPQAHKIALCDIEKGRGTGLTNTCWSFPRRRMWMIWNLPRIWSRICHSRLS